MPRKPTILDVAVSRHGLWRGSQVVAFMVVWGALREELGREPHLDDYIEAGYASRPTAFREQKRFREAFPGHVTPSSVLDLVGDERRSTVGLLGGSTLATA